MKKSIITLIFVFISVSMCFGQMAYVGGALSTSKIGSKRTLNIVPEFGYCINTHNTLSLTFAYSTFTDGDDIRHSIRVTPCYSYIFTLSDNWQLDINASAGYSRFFVAKANMCGVYLGPQLEYYIRPQWTVWCYFDAFALEYDWYDGQASTKNVNFNWFNNGINFGFYYYFTIKKKAKVVKNTNT